MLDTAQADELTSILKAAMAHCGRWEMEQIYQPA